MKAVGALTLAFILGGLLLAETSYAEYLVSRRRGSPLALQQLFHFPWIGPQRFFQWASLGVAVFVVLFLLGLINAWAAIITWLFGLIFIGALALESVMPSSRLPNPANTPIPEKSIPYSPPAEAYLYGKSGERKHRKEVCLTEMRIGRSRACDLRLSDPSVSGKHARIVYMNGFWYLQDEQSKNGTFWNGRQVSAVKLQNGDRIQIGDSEFEFRIDS